jgi:hypothetical protein
MIPAHISQAVTKALYMLPARMTSPEARVVIYAIGLQESRFIHRLQMVGNPPRPVGPAKGFWQFERGGGCKGVVNHQASRFWMSDVCKQRGVPFDSASIWNAIEHDDVLAAAAARLLLFTDPRRLPALGDEQGAWDLYMRTWRPGKPHRDTWDALYAEAMGQVVA